MTDDQTLEQMSALPRTRRLIGRQGVKFKRFYVTDPLCCPSRATFFTGQYAHNTGVISNGGPNAPTRCKRAGHARGLAAAGRLPDRVRRQVPERLRPRRSRARAAGVERVDGAHRADDAGLLRLRPQRGRRGRPLRHGARGLQDPRARSPRGRRDPPRGARQPAAVPLRRLQRPARAEHAGARRRRLARRSRGAALARVRRARPLRQAELPARPPAAGGRSDGPDRRPQPARARVAGRGRPPGRADRRRAARRRASSATRTSSSPPTTATSTASTGSSSASCSPTSPRPSAAADPRPRDSGGGDLGRAGRQRRPGADDRRRSPARGRRWRSTGTRCSRWRATRTRSTDRALLLESLVRDRSTYYGYPYAAIRSGHFLYVDYDDRRRGALQPRPRPRTSCVPSPAKPRYADKQRALEAALERLRDCRGRGCEVTVRPNSP